MPYGLTLDSEDEDTPIQSPIEDTSATGVAIRHGAGILGGGGLAPRAGLGFGAGVLSGRRAAPPAAPQKEQGDFARGLSDSVQQTKQLFHGVKAFVGDAIGSDSMRDEGIKRYNEIGAEIQKTSKPSDSFSEAWEDGDLIDWAQHGAGYVLGQAAEAVATGGIGSFVAKTVAKGALKQGLKTALAKSIEKKVAGGMAEDAAIRSAFGQLGAGVALGGFNLTQELGQIYPEALQQAQESGEDTNLLRVFGSSVLAAAIDTAVDRINIKKAGKILTGETGAGGRLRNIATEAFVSGLREGGTELMQTGIERWGASQDLSSPEAIKDYIDSAALGLLGGGSLGAVAGAAKKPAAASTPPAAEEPIMQPGPAVDPSTVPGYVAASQVDITDDMRQKFAPDLEARGIDPNSEQAGDVIRRLDAIERATGVIRTKQAQQEREQRAEEVRAAFGETATTGVGIGVGQAEPMVQRSSVIPNEGERVLEPVDAAPKTVRLPETSWNDESQSTEAIAPEDVVARQQDWEVPASFEVKDENGASQTVGNRFTAYGSALKFAKDYALRTGETQFQIREGKRAKSEGGGKYFFIEERPMADKADELIVGVGTREQLAPKEKADAKPAAAAVKDQDGAASAGSGDGAAAGRPGAARQAGDGDSVPAPVAAPSAPKGPAAALTRNFGKKRVTFPDADHVETFGHGRLAPQLATARAQLTKLETDQAAKPNKKRAAEIEKAKKAVADLEAKVQASRQRARKAMSDTKSTDDVIDERAVAYNTEVRAHAAAEKGDQVITAKKVGEYTKREEQPAAKVDQPAADQENGPRDAYGQPYSDEAKRALAGIRERTAARSGNDGFVLDLAPLPAGPRGAAFKAAGEVSLRLFGKRLVIVDQPSGKVFNGLFSTEAPNSVFVDKDNPTPVMFTIGHELTHSMRRTDADTYMSLLAQIKRYMRSGAFEEHRQRLDERYAKAGLKPIDADLMDEELVADIAGDFFTEPSFWDSFAENDRVGFDRVVAAVKRFLDNILLVLGGKQRPAGTDLYLSDIEGARTVVAQAMAKYSTNVGEAASQFNGTLKLDEEVDAMSVASDNTSRLGHRSLSNEIAAVAKDAKGSDVGHRREASGRYVGAPDWVGSSPQRLAVLRSNLKRLAIEGEPGRFWYENSSRAILQLAGGDKAEAEKIAALIAIYSPNATVAANTTMALNAYYQFKAGLPIKAGLGAANRKAEDLLRHNKPWGGIKTNSFYQNLMVEIDPSQLDENVATMDMWMALAFDYGKKALDQGPTYKFAEREIQHLAEELGWTAHQVQAAVWTSIKGRVEGSAEPRKAYELKKGIAQIVEETDPETGKTSRSHTVVKGREYDHFRAATKFGMQHELTPEAINDSKYDFSHALEQRAVQISWEATPGESTGVLPGLLKAPLEQKFEYLVAVQKALSTADGRDAIAEMVGLPQGITVNGLSAWKGDTGAGAQTMVSVSMEGNGKSRTFKPAAKMLLDTYAAIRGLVLNQEAVVYHNPVYDDSAIRHNGVQLTTKRPVTQEEMTQLYQALHDRFGTWDLAPGYRPDGVRVLNFVEGLSNKEFQAGIDEVLASLPDNFAGGSVEKAPFRSEGNYIYNDWTENPNGEGYAQEIAARRPDLLGRVADLRARVAAVNEDFTARYSWGPAKSPAAAGAEDLFSLAAPQPIVRPGWDEATIKALNDPFTPPPRAPIKQRIEGLRTDFLRRFVAATVDPFVGLKDLDDKLYMRARLTNGTDGGLEALMHFGQVVDNGGALDVKRGTKGLVAALQPLGNEVEDFFRWVALNRAANLKKQDRENFFTDASIAARHKLVEGKMADGRSRATVYAAALADMNALNRSVLELAKGSGLIDQAGFDRFAADIWYVPFYRVAEESDNDVTAYQAAASLSGQKFGERLKGGTDRVDALLPNVLRNWGSLLAAAQKNSVARDTLAMASDMGAAHQVQAGTAGAAKVMVDGKQKSYLIDDPMLANAVMSINMAALQHPALKVLGSFKRALTGAVTMDPAFKIRNLLRDSIQSIAIADLSFNPIANVAAGMRGLQGDRRASVLAGGGLFGHTMDEADLSARIKRLAEHGIDPKTVLTDPKSVVRAALDGYSRAGEMLENANRVALYNSMIGKGKSHLEAAYAARDLMDFSLQGRSAAVRTLAMVLPFFNARLQGLYKLGRDGIAPTILTVMGRGDESDRAKAARFATVAAAVTMAGLLLYLTYKDDEDFQQRERWDRDNFWWFKVGDVAYRIPKPFELGSIGTIAERGLEQLMDDKAVGADFAKSMTDMLMNTFAFDPIPQAFRPALNLVANRDAFTDRPIETMGMQNLPKAERYSSGTSETAKFLSQINAGVAGALGPLGEGKVLSPAQIDYLARGYFGWLGATIMQSTGQLAKWGDDVESPAARLEDFPVVGAFAREVPAAHSRYVSEFYKSAESIKQQWQEIKLAQSLHQLDKARELMAENKEAVQLHGLYSRSARQISMINQQMRRVEASPTMDADQKREALDTLSQRKSEIARRVELLRREKRSTA